MCSKFLGERGAHKGSDEHVVVPPQLVSPDVFAIQAETEENSSHAGQEPDANVESRAIVIVREVGRRGFPSIQEVVWGVGTGSHQM